MEPKKLVIWAAVAVVVAAGFALMIRPATGPGIEEASPERIAEVLAAGARVIDVRTPGEFEMSHLAGAENVPTNLLATQAQDWDRSEPLVVYCTTGARSSQSISLLADMGFESIYHFTAGLVAWDGALEGGFEVAEMPAAEKPTDSPVVYEFFTDW